jgi:chemotaxis protein CheD
MHVQLRTGELGYGIEDTILSTSGIGSCVVVCLWDRHCRIGAMAHIPYPRDESEGRDLLRNPGLSPDRAIPEMMRQLQKRGCLPTSLDAVLVGAGNMFESLDQSGSMQQLVQSILDNTLHALQQYQLVIRGQAIGGRYGRSVRFEVRNGQLTVTSVDGNVVVL